MFEKCINWSARDAQLTTEPTDKRNPDALSHRDLVEKFYNDKAVRTEQLMDSFMPLYDTPAADNLMVIIEEIGSSMADGGQQIDATTIGNRMIDIVRRELKRLAIEYANDNYEE